MDSYRIIKNEKQKLEKEISQLKQEISIKADINLQLDKLLLTYQVASELGERLYRYYLNIDPFYKKSSTAVLQLIVSYLSDLYNGDLRETIVIEELLALHDYMIQKNYSGFHVFNKMRVATENALFFLAEKEIDSTFIYIFSALENAVVDKKICESASNDSKLIKALFRL